MRPVLHELRMHWVLYCMLLPGSLLFLLFNYLPMGGIVIAFKEINFQRGFLGSPWTGLANFRYFFNSPYAMSVTFNTVFLNVLFIGTSLVSQIGVALLLNEVKINACKRILQSVIFLPYFISWIIVGVFVYNLFQYDHGFINNLLKGVGLPPANWFSESGYWPWILTGIYDWKWTGFGVIIYLAALSSINVEIYEAARIDGASRMQQATYVSLPHLVPTASVLTLLAIGRIMNSDFGMIYGIIGDNSLLYRTTNVIDTFVFRALRQFGDIGMASAAGFYQSIVGLVLVLASNLVARRFSEGGALF